jgi:hypothetical protein
MKVRKVAGIILMIIALAFWLTGISSATSHGFFENQFAVQVLILGGAISMLAGVLWIEW